MKAIITVGIPASGKTTKYAEFYGYIVNRDDIREYLFGNYYSGGYKFTNAKEKQVTELCWERVLTCAAHKMDVVISDTNLNKGRRESLIEELEKLGYEVELDIIECSYELAVKRDLARQKSVGADVIWRFYKQWNEQFGLQKVATIEGLKECYIFDIDGTLASMKGRSPFEWHRVGEDKLNESVASIFRLLRDQGEKIFIFSGRDAVCRGETVEWLYRAGLIDYGGYYGMLEDKKYEGQIELHMRPEESRKKDFDVKLNMFDSHVRGKYNVAGIFDDRPQVCRLWNLLGLPLFKIGDQSEF